MGNNFTNPWDAFNQAPSNENSVENIQSSVSESPQDRVATSNAAVINNASVDAAHVYNSTLQQNAAPDMQSNPTSKAISANSQNASNQKVDWKKIFRPVLICIAIYFVSFILFIITGSWFFLILQYVGELGFFGSCIYVGYFILFKWKIKKQ